MQVSFTLSVWLILMTKSALVWHEGHGSSWWLAHKWDAFIGKTGSLIWILGGSYNQFDLIEFDTNGSGSYINHSNSFNFHGQTGPSSVQNDDLLYMMVSPDINVFDLTSSIITDTITGYVQFAKALYGMYASLGQCLAYYEGVIMILGGEGRHVNKMMMINEFVVYNIHNRTWNNSTNIPISVAYTSCNVVNSVLYLIGGAQLVGTYHATSANTRVYFDTVLTINVSAVLDTSASWDIMNATLSEKRSHHRSVVVDDMIYVVGGLGGVAAPHSVDIINTVSQRIYFDSNLIIGVYDMALISVNHVLYSFGGLQTESHGSTEHFQYAIILPPTNAPSPISSPISSTTIYPSTSSSQSSMTQTNESMIIESTTNEASTKQSIINESTTIVLNATQPPTEAIVTQQFLTTITEHVSQVEIRHDLETTFHLFMCLLVLLFTGVSIIGWIHSKCIHPNDFFQVSHIFSVALQISDMCSDCFFVINLSTHIGETEDGFNSYFFATAISISLIVIPAIISVAQLWHHLNKYWVNNNRINRWIAQYSKYLYLLSFVTGSAFTSVCLVNCNFCTLSVFSMGLSQFEMIRFATKRLHSTIIGENAPQICLQIWYLSVSGNTTSYIALGSLICSVLSIISTVLSLFNQKKIYNAQHRIKITMDVIGEYDPDRSSTKVSKIKKYLADKVFGNNAVEILKPNKVRNGLRLQVELYRTDNDDNTDTLTNDKTLLNQVISCNNELAELIQKSWNVSSLPNIENITVQKIPSCVSQLPSDDNENLVYWSMDALGMVQIEQDDEDDATT
eukprot:245196_1